MIFKYGEKSVVISHEVTSLFEEYKYLEATQDESGGILLGNIYKDLIIIDQIATFSKEEELSRFSFNRNAKRAQKITETIWQESNGERVYLGEWHTHPEDIPTPSKGDKKLVKTMLKHAQVEMNSLFMILIGKVMPYVAVLEKGMKTMKTMEEVTSNDCVDIRFYKDQSNQIYGFQASGYLNIAPYGYDIYNAAFSQISFGMIRSLQILTNLDNYVLEKEPGYIKLIIPGVEREDIRVQTLLEAMEVQVLMLMEKMQSEGLEQHISLSIIESR
jgi:integrative and conjugative element protein (TIGR02256 family)